MIVDLWYQPMISNLWCGPMIDDFDDLPPAAIVAMKFVAGSKLWFLLSTWSSELKCDFKLQLATSTWNFNLQLNVKFWFRNSTSNLNLNLRLRSLIWNFNLKSWLEASIWKFNLQFQFEFLALDLRLDISSEHFSVRTKFVRTCEIEKIIIRAEIVRTKFVRTHVVHNVVQKRFEIEKRCPDQGIYLLMWMRIAINVWWTCVRNSYVHVKSRKL